MNVERLRELLKTRLAQQYASGFIPAAEARALCCELFGVVAKAADCLPRESRAAFLRGLVEQLRDMPTPWE